MLDHKTIAMLQTEQGLISGETTGSGLGWQVRSVTIGDDVGTSTMISAPGNGGGGTTSFVILPEKCIVIAVVSNVSFAEGLDTFAVSLASLFKQE
jgi:CubicO group peptidase (beta-lactamase class C family)